MTNCRKKNEAQIGQRHKGKAAGAGKGCGGESVKTDRTKGGGEKSLVCPAEKNRQLHVGTRRKTGKPTRRPNCVNCTDWTEQKKGGGNEHLDEHRAWVAEVEGKNGFGGQGKLYGSKAP